MDVFTMVDGRMTNNMAKVFFGAKTEKDMRVNLRTENE